MSEKIQDDGGPAFPCEGGACSGLHSHPGMSLRDHFAGLAMQELMGHFSRNDGILSRDYSDVANESYLMADAMLAARKETR